jgi:hypothetical protein
MTHRDSRFLRTPPYAFQIGAVAAVGAVWKLLTQAAREEREADQDQAGKAATPPNRRQA